MAAGHNALAGLSGPGKHSSEEGLLDLCMKVDGLIGAVGSCVKDSVGLKGSRVLGIASGWSGHGDKEVGRQEACCLGWDEDDLANVLAARSMESHTVGIAVFGENETLGLHRLALEAAEDVLVSCCTLGALKHDVVAFVSITLAAERCLQLPQQVRGVSLVLGERGCCNLECRDLSTQTARRRGGWRHCSQCFSISGVASVLGTSNSYTVGGSSILSGDVNLGDESADAIAITGDATFSNGNHYERRRHPWRSLDRRCQ